MLLRQHMNYVNICQNCVIFFNHPHLTFMVRKIRSVQKRAIMETTVGYWNVKKEKLKEKFPTITDEDLLYRDGKEKEMMELLGYKLGKTHEELRIIFAAL